MKNRKQSSMSHDLLQAVEKNEISEVKKLIENGCDVNVRDKGGSTPLMRAALHGYTDLLAFLILSGANTNLSDAIGKTALHYAAQEYHDDVVVKLLDAGAPVNSQDMHGNSPLSNAVFYSNGRGSVIRNLLRHGADVHLANKHGVTPLALAKSIANYDVFQYFEGMDSQGEN